MLTAQQIADRLRVSRQCVYTLIDERLLSASRVGAGGRAIRVRPDDFMEFLKKCRVPRRSPTRQVKTAPAPSAFKQLDAAVLRRAWKEQGIDPHD